MGEERPIRLHAVAAGIKVAARQDFFGVQDLDELVPRNLGQLLLYLQDNVLIIAAFGFIPGEHPNARKSGQLTPILKVVPAVVRDKLIQALQARQAHGGTDLVHLAISADILDVVVSVAAKVLDQKSHVEGKSVD